MDTMYGLLLNSEGVVTATMESNVLASGAVEVPEDVYRRAVAGRSKYVDDHLEDYVPPPPPPSVPAAITPLQARRALRTVPGLKDQVDAYVANLPEEDQEAWEYALTIERNHPVVLAAIAGGLLTEEQTDQLFTLGATL